MKGLLALCLLVPLAAAAEVVDAGRAQFNYQMSCQGCHAPDGSGDSAVPRMRGTVGMFLDTPRGREYLVRVPGSAVSALDDAELAEVLNWIIQEFAGDYSSIAAKQAAGWSEITFTADTALGSLPSRSQRQSSAASSRRPARREPAPAFGYGRAARLRCCPLRFDG